MNTFTEDQIKVINTHHSTSTPEEIVTFAIRQSSQAVVTTNFRPYEAAILHVCTSVKNTIPVVWCDSGYNTEATYQHAQQLISQLNLNIDLYVPAQTRAHRNVIMGIPDVNSPNHALFTKQVKLEPFNRAMRTHQPQVWFTNLRKGQTALRDTLDVFSLGKNGVLKVSPFFHYSDEQLDVYLEEHGLPNEFDYYDPTKVLENRECGIHL